MEEKKVIRRGTIYYADLDPVRGSEQGGYRPVLILQNNIGNEYSPTVIIAAIVLIEILYDRGIVNEATYKNVVKKYRSQCEEADSHISQMAS